MRGALGGVCEKADLPAAADESRYPDRGRQPAPGCIEECALAFKSCHGGVPTLPDGRLLEGAGPNNNPGNVTPNHLPRDRKYGSLAEGTVNTANDTCEGDNIASRKLALR